MNDFIATPDDARELHEAEIERDLDPDFALISDYVAGALSEIEAAAVRTRLDSDPAFRERAEPLLLAWQVPTRTQPGTREALERRWLELRRRTGMPPVPGQIEDIDRLAQFQARVEQRHANMLRERVMVFATVLVFLMAIPLVGVWLSDRPAAEPPTPSQLMEEIVARRGVTGVLPDGSVAELVGQSTLRYATGFALGRTVELRGEAMFRVSSMGGQPFTVMTTDAEIWVTGTNFSVNAQENAPTIVSVREGSVSVRPRLRNKVMTRNVLVLKAGERASVRRDAQPERLP